MCLRSLLLTAVIVSCACASAHADTVALAPLPNAANGSLTAYGGWVTWSTSNDAGTRWRLMAFHAGRVLVLPIAPRAVPFDADAGPDARGRPILVYSRCTTEPPLFGGSAQWSKSRGCRLYAYPLGGGRPRPIGAGYAPSQWRGTLAFARAAAHGVSQIFLQHPGHRLQRLPGGTVDCRHASPCNAGGHRVALGGWVQAMDLGARVLAYKWTLEGPNVPFDGGPAWEMRVDPLNSRTSLIAATGYPGGACLGAQPLSPNALGTSILFAQSLTNCNLAPRDPGAYRTYFEQLDTANRRERLTPPPSGQIGAVARDGASTYWMRIVPVIEGFNDINPGCTPTQGTCTLIVSSALAFGRSKRNRDNSPPIFAARQRVSARR